MANYHRQERMEAQQILRALRQRWDIPPEVRKTLPARLQVLSQSDDSATAIAAGKALLECDKLNLQDEQMQLIRQIAADQAALNDAYNQGIAASLPAPEGAAGSHAGASGANGQVGSG